VDTTTCFIYTYNVGRHIYFANVLTHCLCFDCNCHVKCLHHSSYPCRSSTMNSAAATLLQIMKQLKAEECSILVVGYRIVLWMNQVIARNVHVYNMIIYCSRFKRWEEFSATIVKQGQEHVIFLRVDMVIRVGYQ